LREQLPWPIGKPFRILSIDGGGIRGILPAAILSELEERFLGGKPIGGYFDLITGTSTGGIIALSLGTGFPAKQLLELYLLHGEEVFPPLRWDLLRLRSGLRWLRSLHHHRYDPEPLASHLAQVFGDRIFGEAMQRLCIPSFDDFTEVNVFKTPHHPDYRIDWRERLLTVAMATAAAPTFFPVYRNRGRAFADGGVWANDPAMIGLVDALACYGLDRRQIHILSLGTGDSDLLVTTNQVLRGGVWHWREIIVSAMHLQSQNALGQAGLLVGRDQLIRLNAPMPDRPIALDDYARASTELPPMAKILVNQFGETIRDRFLFGPAEPYKAFHGPRAQKGKPKRLSKRSAQQTG
jgi:patatin-like phospholipase/acyl hydrolase